MHLCLHEHPVGSSASSFAVLPHKNEPRPHHKLLLEFQAESHPKLARN